MDKLIKNASAVKTTVAVLLMVIWFVGTAYLFSYHKQVTKSATKGVVEERAELVHQYLDVTIALVGFMRNQMEFNLKLASQGALIHPQSQQLVDYPQYNIWALKEAKPDNAAPLSKGMISGKGRLIDLNDNVKDEIDAALALELNIGEKLHGDLEFIWAYYMSTNDFVLLSPWVPIDDFHFQDFIYDKPFWTPAIPENNPQRKTIISELYEDAAGRGFMISISAPVYYQDVFKGVASLDIGLNKLEEVLHLGNVKGNSYLVDEQWRYLASFDKFTMGDKLASDQPVSDKYSCHEFSNYLEFQLPIIDNEVYLIHRVPTAIWRQMVLSSMGFHLSLFTSLLVVIYLLLSLALSLGRVKELAIKDDMTDLLNRRAIDARGKKLLLRDNNHLMALMLDIDHFKSVNDRYGHHIGDVVIQEVAKTLRRCCRNNDLLARFGGEEFLLLLPETNSEQACQLAEQIRSQIEQAPFSKFALHVSVSIGCVQRRDNENYCDLIKRADKALYSAKHMGRNRVVCFNSMD